MQSYKTIDKNGESEVIEKKSRFLGYAAKCENEEEAKNILASIKKQHYNAKHCVSAYILKNGMRHSSDDGEPQGTAGAPLLNVIDKMRIENCIISVVRYFGGTLLGTGGLVRAYTNTGSLALKNAEIVEMREYIFAEIDCSYNLYGIIPSIIVSKDGIIENSDFADNVKIIFRIEPQYWKSIVKEITNLSAGKFIPKIIKKKYCKYNVTNKK